MVVLISALSEVWPFTLPTYLSFLSNFVKMFFLDDQKREATFEEPRILFCVVGMTIQLFKLMLSVAYPA